MTRSMAASDPRHGNDQPVSMVVKGCPCESCERRRTRARRLDKNRKLGRYKQTTPDVTVAHAEKLIAAGWLAEHIAAAAGIGMATLSEIMRGIRHEVYVDTERAVLAVTGPPVGYTIPAEPTKRRLRALAALGYSLADVSQRAGQGVGYARTLLNSHERVRADPARRIAALYDELCMVVPPDTATARVCRSKARNKGWPPPLAWNDIDDMSEPKPRVTTRREVVSHDSIDESVVLRILAGDKLAATRAERVEVMRRWLMTGRPAVEMTGRMNWHDTRYLPPEFKEAG